MSSSPDHNLLQPPRRQLNPDHVIPLTPHIRPPFAHYQSSSTLPPTPHTPYSPRSPSRTSSGTPTTKLRPYLSLFPRILLTLFSPCLLPIILTIAHLIQNRSSTASLAASAKQSVLSACSGLAKGAASIQTMPRYLAMQTNEEMVRATQASIRAVGSMLMDAVKIIEVVVNFIVETYRSLLLCTIELAVRGTLEIVIHAVEVITDGITTSLNAIRTSIQSDISSANRLIQSAVDGVNSLFGSDIDVPEFSIPSLDFLANVTVPTDFEDSLIKLNATLPTLSQLKDKMEAIISIPFEALIKEINETRIEMADSFNSTMLPVPSLSSLAADKANGLQTELCTGLDTSLIDDTANALHKLSNVAIGLMFLLLFCIWAALAIWESRKWRAMQAAVEAVEDEWRRENTVDAWRMVAIVEHPVLEKYASGILARVAPSQRTRTNLRWFLSYLAHPTCLALLFISLLGFLSIQFQLVALDALKAHARENANATVAASTNSLTTKLNAAALQSSKEYAAQYNEAIGRYQQRIDDELFGSWLNTTATTLNTTLVEFYNDVENVLNTTFGGTILFNPINTFMYCILGSKIDNLEKGLTWIRDHAHIDLPTLPDDILMLSDSSINEIATPIASAAVGSGSGEDEQEDEGVVGSLISHFESALKVERTFYAIMLGVWLTLFLIGLIIVFWNSGGRDKYAAWRRTAPSDNDDNSPSKSRWIPWIKETHPIYDTYAEKRFRGTTPTNADIPRIIEPDAHNVTAGQDEKSYFNYPDQSTRRPFVPRKGTFGSTISSLAAPGQAFLKITGRKISTTSNRDDNDHSEHLVEQGAATSEKYNSPFSDPQPERPETPQPFWVNRFYGVVDGVKGLLPTRGQRHGAALARNGSQRTEKSFGASQVPTAVTMGRDWPTDNDCTAPPEKGGRTQEPRWTMVDPQSIGRALDSGPGDSRYPPLNHTPTQPSHPIAGSAAHSVYPRPMSRAPTLGEGMILPRSNPFADRPPSLPPKPPSKSDAHLENKHDSVDYLASESGSGDEYADADVDAETGYDSDDRHGGAGGILSPASSSNSYFAAEPRMVSANRIHVGHGRSYSQEHGKEGKGTMALAEILQELQEKKFQEGQGHDGIEDPFVDGRS
ncbi:plasma membrane fusion protein PRM1 [Kwoniella heveanensis CBS 569]|nr:plasma membrane fusion protein PRM1 [Kwoniella heveanensis CBS 569]